MVQFDWVYQGKQSTNIKQYVKTLGLPRKFISHIKFDGGEILLNGKSVNVLAPLETGDQLTIIAPPEKGHETVPPSYVPIEVVYEDRDLLIVNKPNNVISIPSRRVPDSAMANRIKGYYIDKGYEDQVVHIVTRLDRQTTGLMMVAKHRLAHALMDQQIQQKKLKKFYTAISSRIDWPLHGMIDEPIARTETSIITRRVHPTGQQAQTEYWLVEQSKQGSLLKLQLHTGRTHQIRVHMAHEKGVLIGDTLYGGEETEDIKRQALHCSSLFFEQPFTREKIELTIPLASDMQRWLEKLKQIR